MAFKSFNATSWIKPEDSEYEKQEERTSLNRSTPSDSITSGNELQPIDFTSIKTNLTTILLTSK